MIATTQAKGYKGALMGFDQCQSNTINAMQATMASEEERLGVDFGQLWEKRQKADVVRAVEAAEKPSEAATGLSDAGFATKCFFAPLIYVYIYVFTQKAWCLAAVDGQASSDTAATCSSSGVLYMT